MCIFVTIEYLLLLSILSTEMNSDTNNNSKPWGYVTVLWCIIGVLSLSDALPYYFSDVLGDLITQVESGGEEQETEEDIKDEREIDDFFHFGNKRFIGDDRSKLVRISFAYIPETMLVEVLTPPPERVV